MMAQSRAFDGDRFSRTCSRHAGSIIFTTTLGHAPIRQYGYVDDNRLALAGWRATWPLSCTACRTRSLGRLPPHRQHDPPHRAVLPRLSTSCRAGRMTGTSILNWRDKESGQIFGPHQLSDGTLRAMCLVALLLQPEAELPGLIIVDEPELGLHPYALNLIASLFKTASHHTQVLISTQSSTFLDQFEPEDVIVVDREGKESIFRRPDPVALEAGSRNIASARSGRRTSSAGGLTDGEALPVRRRSDRRDLRRYAPQASPREPRGLSASASSRSLTPGEGGEFIEVAGATMSR